MGAKSDCCRPVYLLTSSHHVLTTHSSTIFRLCYVTAFDLSISFRAGECSSLTAYRQPDWVGPRVGGHLAPCCIHHVNQGELSQCFKHDDRHHKDCPGIIIIIIIANKSVFAAVLEIMGPKYIGVMTLTFLGHMTSSHT